MYVCRHQMRTISMVTACAISCAYIGNACLGCWLSLPASRQSDVTLSKSFTSFASAVWASSYSFHSSGMEAPERHLLLGVLFFSMRASLISWYACHESLCILLAHSLPHPEKLVSSLPHGFIIQNCCSREMVNRLMLDLTWYSIPAYKIADFLYGLCLSSTLLLLADAIARSYVSHYGCKQVLSWDMLVCHAFVLDPQPPLQTFTLEEVGNDSIETLMKPRLCLFAR